MDCTQNFIVLKGAICTEDVVSIQHNPTGNLAHVTFTNGKSYEYRLDNVNYLANPVPVNPIDYQLKTAHKTLFKVAQCITFKDGVDIYTYVMFEDGSSKSYLPHQLQIIPSALCDDTARSVLGYLRHMAEYSELKGDDDTAILLTQYQRLDYVRPESGLSCYLNPQKNRPKSIPDQQIPIFPFGCNASQHKAVVNALTNQISVIEGPPGTGKTQTILNIIANLLVQGKTVQVVSNNNSATANVLEKLATYDLDFLAAPLGSNTNKEAFLAQQTGAYPDFTAWQQENASEEALDTLGQQSQKLTNLFAKQERLAQAKMELQELTLEYQHFLQQSTPVTIPSKKPTSKSVMTYWQALSDLFLHEKPIPVWRKLWGWFWYGIRDFSKPAQVLLIIKHLYYLQKQDELQGEIDHLTQALAQENFAELLHSYSTDSMAYLKNHLYHSYGNKSKRTIFNQEAFWKDSTDFLREYPVVSSTTFSSARNVDKGTLFDYVIMDEASQIDITTAALALSSAKNVVIVGDLNQLPHVISNQLERELDQIFPQYHLDEAYHFSNSFLSSICKLLPETPRTLLREHYRCHPAIIQFCNQKFYGGELLIMTENHGEEDTMILYQTVSGNHNRGHINQRQIDVILQEVLPNIHISPEEVGIIAPYKDQTQALRENGISSDTATVHKFQGREKDTMILSTVDEHWKEFSDQPTLINVAVSRAKNHLVVVSTGNPLPAGSNLADLIGYIRYRNFQVIQSNITSVFDYLYAQYTKERLAFLSTHRRVSEYDSETLMYHLICDVLKVYPGLFTAIHVPLGELVGREVPLSEEARLFAHHPNAHVDFLIYNTLTKEPVLVVEVDGFDYHNTPDQKRRDGLKNHILDTIHLPYLRCPTNGSGERAQLVDALTQVYTMH